MTDQEFAAAIPRKIDNPTHDAMSLYVTMVQVVGLDCQPETVSKVFNFDVDTGSVNKSVRGEVFVTFTNPATRSSFRLERDRLSKVLGNNVFEQIVQAPHDGRDDGEADHG